MLPDEATDASHALQMADERLYAQKYSRRGESERTMAALLAALAFREPELEAQRADVGVLALERRHDARAFVATSSTSSSVPPSCTISARSPSRTRSCTSPGPLDEREWEFVRQHTIVGERILRASPALRSVAGIVRSSHENWDGSGYPDGLAGEEAPLASRIIRVCSAYVAMLSERPYRPALSEEDALAELMRLAGTEYDATIVRMFVAHVRDEHEAERAA